VASTEGSQFRALAHYCLLLALSLSLSLSLSLHLKSSRTIQHYELTFDSRLGTRKATDQESTERELHCRGGIKITNNRKVRTGVAMIL
jgi:hypothetical protein